MAYRKKKNARQRTSSDKKGRQRRTAVGKELANTNMRGKNMINIAVAQSGGPTCAINASLVGVFREALKHSTIDAIFGSVNGIEGINRKPSLVDLKSMIRTNDDMELLRQTPSTVLGSCRYKLPDFHEDETVYRKIAETLKQRNTVHSSTSAATIQWILSTSSPSISARPTLTPR